MNYLSFFNKNGTKKLALCAVLTALSVVLSLASFPIFPAAPFLRMDFADVSLFILGMVCGWVYGLIGTLISCSIQDSINPSPYHAGLLIHFLVTGLAMLVISLIYKYYLNKKVINKIKNDSLDKKQFKIDTVKYLFISFFSGGFVWFLFAIVLNLTITPAIYYMNVKEVIDSYFLFIVLFNLIKYITNFAITLFISVRTHSFVKKHYSKKLNINNQEMQQNSHVKTP